MGKNRERSSGWIGFGHGIGVMVAASAMFAACLGDEEPVEPSCGDSSCTEGELLAGCRTDCFSDLGAFDVDLAACSRGSSDAELEAELQFPLGIARSFEAVGDAGDRTDTLATDFTRVLFRLAEDPEADVLSVPFEFEAGVYELRLATLGRGVATVRILAADDYTAFAKGDLIEVYPFVAEAYFLGAQVDLGALDATVTFDGVGPLVELLGKGPDPESPLTVSLFEAFRETGRQVVELKTTLDATLPDAIHVGYEMTSRRRASLDDGAITPIELVSFTAEQNATTAQVMSFDLHYRQQTRSGVAPYGTVELEVAGGRIAGGYRMAIVFPENGLRPEVSIQCRP